MREFEEAGYGDGVIVKSADEDLDEVIPSMDLSTRWAII